MNVSRRKGLYKVKKTALTSLIIISVITLYITPFFHIVKAETLTPGKVTEYGSYLAETYTVSNGYEVGYEVAGFSITAPMVSGSSVFHFHYSFNDVKSGYLTLQVTTPGHQWYIGQSTYFVDGGWFSLVPQNSGTASTYQFTIRFKDTNYIDFTISYKTGSVFDASTFFYLNSVSINDYYTENENLDEIVNVLNSNFDIKLSDWDATFNQILTSIQSLADYQIDNESILAYYFVLSNLNTMQIEYNNGDVTTAVSVSQNGYTRPIAIPANTSYYFYFYTSVNSINLIPANARGFVEVDTIPPTMSGYRLVRVTLNNNTDQNFSERYIWSDSAVIVPLYFGDGYAMSQAMQSITKHDSESYMTKLIHQIIDALNDTDSDLVDSTLFNNVLNNISTFLTSVGSTVPNAQTFDDDIGGLPQFIVDGTYKLHTTASLVNDVYTQLTTTFPFLKIVAILSLGAMLIGVFR